MRGQGNVSPARACAFGVFQLDGAGGGNAVVVGKEQTKPAQPRQHRKLELPAGLCAFQRGRGYGRTVIAQGKQHPGNHGFRALQGRVAECERLLRGTDQGQAGAGPEQIDGRARARRRHRIVGFEYAGIEIRPLQRERALVRRVGCIGQEQIGPEATAVGNQGKEMFPVRGLIRQLRGSRQGRQQGKGGKYAFVQRAHSLYQSFLCVNSGRFVALLTDFGFRCGQSANFRSFSPAGLECQKRSSLTDR